jgi:hypothetical protein
MHSLLRAVEVVDASQKASRVKTTKATDPASRCSVASLFLYGG